MKKSLNLKKERLAELSADELQDVVGGADSASCPVTYTCVCVSVGACNSFGCLNIGGSSC